MQFLEVCLTALQHRYTHYTNRGTTSKSRSSKLLSTQANAYCYLYNNQIRQCARSDWSISYGLLYPLTHGNIARLLKAIDRKFLWFIG